MATDGRPVHAADGQQRIRSAPRAALALFMVLALIGLTACGSATASGGPSAAGHAARGAPLCRDGQRLDQVVVSVISQLPASPYRTFLPRQFTITDRPEVRALAAAVCALPAAPKGVLSCPVDRGGVVKLAFSAPGRPFAGVRIQESGCRYVTGGGPARLWARSPRFGWMLDKMIGEHRLTQAGKTSVPTP